MSVLDGFKVFDFNEGAPYFSITKNGVTFNKSVIIKLGYPERARLYIDEKGKRIALQPANEADESSAGFYKKKANGTLSVRWSGRDLLNTLSEITGWNLEEKSYRVEGQLLREERIMIFELSDAIEMK